MKLSEEDRNIIVGLQMEKAHLFLQQADEMYRQHYWALLPIVIIMLAIMQFKPYSSRMA